MKQLIIITGLLLAFAAEAFSQGTPVATAASLKVGDIAPDFTARVDQSNLVPGATSAILFKSHDLYRNTVFDASLFTKLNNPILHIRLQIRLHFRFQTNLRISYVAKNERLHAKII